MAIQWHPSRPGFYYYTFGNASLKSCNQKFSRKFSVMVVSLPSPVEVPPATAPIPPPISGGVVSSSPAYPWPFRPRDQTALPPAPVPSSGDAKSPMTVPTVVPGDKGGSIPFINSNPAVPFINSIPFINSNPPFVLFPPPAIINRWDWDWAYVELA